MTGTGFLRKMLDAVVPILVDEGQDRPVLGFFLDFASATRPARGTARGATPRTGIGNTTSIATIVTSITSWDSRRG